MANIFLSLFIGALNDNASLLWFIIIPEGVQFVLGLLMYLTGFFLACCCGDQSNANDKNETAEAAKRLRTLRYNFGAYGFVYMIFKVFFERNYAFLQVFFYFLKSIIKIIFLFF